ncbi:hypothetical protein [Streptomyces sp. NPDC057460]|uniref:hypothetical protein n=1 Tax=Streptomyces sp. NPDC057460 TaxID=3346141 RepID=UPI003680FAD6
MANRDRTAVGVLLGRYCWAVQEGRPRPAGSPGEDTDEAVCPMGAVHGLFTTEDELGNPIAQHLSDVLGDSDEDDEE